MINEPNITYVLSISWLPLAEPWRITTTIAAGGLSGGVASSMADGDFLDGVCNGLISSGLNHAMHLVVGGIQYSLNTIRQSKNISHTITLKGVGLLPFDSAPSSNGGLGFGAFQTATYVMTFSLSISSDGKYAILSVISDHTHVEGNVSPVAYAELLVDGQVTQIIGLSPSQTGDYLPVSGGCWDGWEAVGHACFEIPQGDVVRLNVYGGWNVYMDRWQPVMGVNTDHLIPYPTFKPLSISDSFYIKNKYGWSMLNNN